MQNKSKILICAYACQPHRGSEPGVGWNMVSELANNSQYKYLVATRSYYKTYIEKETIPDNLEFFYYELPQIFIRLKERFNLLRIYYYLWMLGAYIKLRKQKNSFYIIHHLTFVNDWLPSLFVLFKTKYNHFIWGPIGSHSRVNSIFLNSRKEKVIERIRIFLQTFYRTFDPFFMICKKQSSKIIGINNNVKNKLKLKHKLQHKFISFPAIALSQKQIDEAIYQAKKKRISKETFNIISVGRLMYIKNFHFTISVFAEFLKSIPENEKEKIILTIIGEGSQKNALIEKCKTLNIYKNVQFLGNIPQKEVMNYFSKANVFLFPTLESAGFVILEAMVNFLPVLALNTGGPKQFLKEETENQLVEYDNRMNKMELINSMASKLKKLYNNSDLINKIGLVNHNEIVNNYTWDKKAKKVISIYNSLK
ncbi:glycosyltransferase family 4 protein [Meridianimaribacter flavus]|uniref:Glycosyltransferase involved in cell wall biosynthesis n=1 Tax=Meridianimaribacter flavus TaxID=571115 RepID=A0ABY2G8K4_9FLAO|nr:glycosyltransferase [Meridianimaribacter flavus]TDY13593.1 glycosyltransferase involved in cell wall biosynthesis [Meridianimaribacter flavus]